MIVNFMLSSPLSHGTYDSRPGGNYTAFRRISIISGDKVLSLPMVSGNSIRGVMRRSIMQELYDTAGINMDLFTQEFASKAARAWNRTYAALFGGGTIDSIDVNINTGELRQIRKALPPLSLFGSALYGAMLSGVMNVGFAIPKCRESIEAGLWTGESGGSMYSGELVGNITMMRRGDHEVIDSAESRVKPMIYTVETLSPGTEMQFTLSFDRIATEIEKDCAAHALSLVKIIGGQKAKGFGEIKLCSTPPESGEYINWLHNCDVKAEILKLAEMLL